MGSTVSRPYRLMLIGVACIWGATLVQRLGAAAPGFSPDSGGYRALLQLWWIIGGVPIA